jgi:mannose-1-phosphate guanylyltransferase
MEKNKNLFVVLMAGGVGVRFWPYSRNSKPKQFLDILGTGKTLIQATYDRFTAICPKENIIVVTSQEHAELTKEQLPDLTAEQILAEPMRKNTAPCIAYAAWKIKSKNPNAVMIISPTDHLVLNEAEFHNIMVKSFEKAQKQDCLITIGIKPTRPETGYGYIQYLENKSSLKKVKTFTEKPEISIAKKFVESGDFVWNAGIFIWGVDAIVKALQTYSPDIAESFDELATSFNTSTEQTALQKAYSVCKSISIDFAVMEKADNVYVMLATFAWSDLGSWGSLHEASQRDTANNHVEGMAQIYDSRNCFIKGQPDKLMVIQGLNNYLIGWFDDVLIVCEKDREELFRRYVNDIKEIPDGTRFL